MASDVFFKSGLRPAKLAQCFLLHSCVDDKGAEFRIVVMSLLSAAAYAKG